MQDQETCDRMKQVCVDAGLPSWGLTSTSFRFYSKENVFGCDEAGDFFILSNNKNMKHTQVTEPEFLTLLNEYKSKENGK